MKKRKISWVAAAVCFLLLLFGVTVSMLAAFRSSVRQVSRQEELEAERFGSYYALISEDDDTLFQLGNPWGEYGFRSAVAEYLYQARGMRCRPEQILIGAGNDYLLMLLGTILGKNRVIAMEDHTYLTAYYDFLHIGYDALSPVSRRHGYAPETPYGTSGLGRGSGKSLHH